MKRTDPDLSREAAYWSAGLLHVAGVDEAGRGPWAGPVVAAAVILPPAVAPAGLAGVRDSKQLSPRRREALYPTILFDRPGLGRRHRLIRGDRPAGHPAGHPPGHAPGRRRPGRDPAGPADRRRAPARPPAAPARPHPRRRPLPVHRRRLHHRQGHPGPAHGGDGRRATPATALPATRATAPAPTPWRFRSSAPARSTDGASRRWRVASRAGHGRRLAARPAPVPPPAPRAPSPACTP